MPASKPHLAKTQPQLPNSPTPNTLLNDHIAQFWSTIETPTHPKTQQPSIQSLLNLNKTPSSIQAAFDHATNLLRLSRSDFLEIRFILPSLFLRLGRDQDCYDFVKWWEDNGEAEREGDGYERENVSLPWLDLRDVDVFVDDSDLSGRKECDLAFTVAGLLVKIRVFVSLENLVMGESYEHGDDVAGQLKGLELSDAIIRNPRRSDIVDAKNIKQNITDLRGQIQNLYLGVQQVNPYFWPAILEPGSHLTAELQTYERGSVLEMETILQYSYAAWSETPGAIDMIRELSK